MGTPSRAAFAERVRDLMAEDASVKPLVEPLLTILVTMLDQFARLTKQVLDIVRREKVCRRLMSVPGVGRQERRKARPVLGSAVSHMRTTVRRETWRRCAASLSGSQFLGSSHGGSVGGDVSEGAALAG